MVQANAVACLDSDSKNGEMRVAAAAMAAIGHCRELAIIAYVGETLAARARQLVDRTQNIGKRGLV